MPLCGQNELTARPAISGSCMIVLRSDKIARGTDHKVNACEGKLSARSGQTTLSSHVPVDVAEAHLDALSHFRALIRACSFHGPHRFRCFRRMA
eukprot:359706-Chlamydomonas_euryale.AAC.3